MSAESPNPARSAARTSAVLSAAAAVLANVAMVAAPLLLLFGRSFLTLRQLSLLLLLATAPAALLKLRQADGETRRVLLQAPLLIALLLLAAFLLDDHRAMLAVPVVINAVLLVTFASTLRREVPMVERFARLVEPELSPAEVRYCRSVTKVWCVFFVLNGGAAAALALAAPLSWWAIFTGGISYGLMGAVFSVEYLVRKLRFRRYGRALPDLLLARLFPPRHPRP